MSLWNTADNDWDLVSGGRGPAVLDHSYVGRDAAGGSSHAFTQYRTHLKKIILAEDSVILAVEGYITSNTSTVESVWGCVYADNAGVPDVLLGYGGSPDVNTLNFAAVRQWLSIPLSRFVPAGTYWVGLQSTDTSGAISVASDATGGDDYYNSEGGPWFTGDISGTAVSTTINSSIRASVVTATGPSGASGALTLVPDTGTTYTPVLTDANALVTLSDAAAIALTLPQDSDVAFPIGTQIHFMQIGAGQVTVSAGTGATLNSPGPTNKFRAQYSTVTAIKRAANTWAIMGDLAAS